MFCVAYALMGIPLNIVMFQSIGERFNIGITIVLHRIKTCLRMKHSNISHWELTLVGCILCGVVLVGGALAFSYFEDWEFPDAFYFCFITMSTIGFGDYVALQQESEAALQTQPEYVAFCIIYILFGLTVFAASLNLMVLKLLTLNTLDERKDQLDMLAAYRRAPKLTDDIIDEEMPDAQCSTNCNDIELPNPGKERKSTIKRMKIESLQDRKKSNKFKFKERRAHYTVARPPCSISHLLPMQPSLSLLPRLSETQRQENMAALAEQQSVARDTTFTAVDNACTSMVNEYDVMPTARLKRNSC